jgi:hypothetical protein
MVQAVSSASCGVPAAVRYAGPSLVAVAGGGVDREPEGAGGAAVAQPEQHEYVRHGALALLAGLDVHTGTVSVRIHPGDHEIVPFTDLAGQVMARPQYKNAARVYVIADNGPDHRGTAGIERLRVAHPNAIMIHTSKPPGRPTSHQIRLSRKPRRALRRDQRLREMHFAQASEPSLASAPHGHAGPRRHPARPERSVICSPSSHQCRSSLLSGIQERAARQPRVPSAPGTMFLPGRAFLTVGWAVRLLLPAIPRAPLFLVLRGVSPVSRESAMRAGGPVTPDSYGSSRRADRLWPPFFRDLPVEPGRAASDSTAARRAELRIRPE